MKRTRIVTLLVAVVIAGCGGEDVTDTTSSFTGTSTTLATSTTLEPTTTTPDTTTSLPGEPIIIGPGPGAVLAVIGVEHDDVLNVRAAPGAGEPVVAELDPLADGVIAQGEARLLPGSIWYAVDVDGRSGWLNSSFVAYLGMTTDETSAVVEALGGPPLAETMVDLGAIVADVFASDDPPSRIVMVATPAVGDLGEVAFDVVGLGDDAVVGFRLRIFGTPDEGGEGFVLRSVERTLLCDRGLSDGLCV